MINEKKGCIKMEEFERKADEFYCEFGKGKHMVLSTAEGNKVFSRMMSIVQMDGIFYFQTDLTLRKYSQLINNNNVALCIDNIQIEGQSREIGHPLKNVAFCCAYRDCFKGSFEAYSSLKNERLFEVKPLKIERWVYEDRNPYIEILDFENRQYSLERYSGI